MHYYFFRLKIIVIFLTTHVYSSFSQEIPKLHHLADSLAKNHEMILLGEQSHHTEEDFVSVNAIATRLFENHSFTLFQTESPFISSYLHLRYPEQQSKLEEILIHYQNSSALVPVRRLVRQSDIRHLGFDPQPMESLSEEHIKLISNDFNLNEKDRALFMDGLESYSLFQKASPEFYALCDNLYDKETNLLKKQLLYNVIGIKETLEGGAVDYSVQTEKSWKPSDNNPRDILMGKNIVFWHKYFKNQKTVVLGASAHLAYDFSVLSNDEMQDFIPAGHQVSLSTIKSACVAFGSYEGTNEKITEHKLRIEHDLFDNDKETVIISSASVPKERYFTSLIDSHPFEAKWSKTFDVFVFNRHRSDRKNIKEKEALVYQKKSKNWTGKIIDEETKFPVIGANVYVKNGNDLIGTATDVEGKYSLSIPQEYTIDSIYISSVIYGNKNLSVKDWSESLTLSSKNKVLESIIVRSKSLNPRKIIEKALKMKEENYLTKEAIEFDSKLELIFDQPEDFPYYESECKWTNKWKNGFSEKGIKNRDENVKVYNTTVKESVEGLSSEISRESSFILNYSQLYRLRFETRKQYNEDNRNFFSIYKVQNTLKRNKLIRELEARGHGYDNGYLKWFISDADPVVFESSYHYWKAPFTKSKRKKFKYNLIETKEDYIIQFWDKDIHEDLEKLSEADNQAGKKTLHFIKNALKLDRGEVIISKNDHIIKQMHIFSRIRNEGGDDLNPNPGIIIAEYKSVYKQHESGKYFLDNYYKKEQRMDLDKEEVNSTLIHKLNISNIKILEEL